MSTFKTKFNPFSKKLQWVLDANLLKIKGTVDTVNDLPLTGNAENDCYITKDTDRLYTWSISASSGLITDWKDVGSTAEIDWSAITNKPSSTPTDIDDAVSKKHTQNTDTKLAEGTANEVTASELVKSLYNIVLLAFKLAVQGSLTIFNMVDGFVDEYEDESGVDTGDSINAYYNSSNDYYTPLSSDIGEMTKLMLHCDGTDGSTIFTDSSLSGHNITANGNAQIDTAIKKFGTGSLLCNGSGDDLSIPDSDDFNFGSGDFTIDFWVNFDALNTSQGFMGATTSGDQEQGFYFYWENTASVLTWRWRATDSVRVDYSYNWSPSINTWYHIAIVRNGTNLYLFIDGDLKTWTSVPNSISTRTLKDTDGAWHIGSEAVWHWLKGLMDEVRISKGIARWTENFTPRTEAYSASANMLLLSESQPAEEEPNTARLVIFEEDIDEIALNTDLKAYISKDDGDTWAEATLVDECDYDITKRILVSNIDLSQSGIGSGTDILYKLVTDNEKLLRIHGTAILWNN